MAAGKLTLGYVLSQAVAEDVFMGGAMVTDAYGLPLEFRYTEPVRATKLQRILYGDVLEKYIHGDVIAGNLISRLEQKPDLFLVSDPGRAGRRAERRTPRRAAFAEPGSAAERVRRVAGHFRHGILFAGVRQRLSGSGSSAGARP